MKKLNEVLISTKENSKFTLGEMAIKDDFESPHHEV